MGSPEAWWRRSDAVGVWNAAVGFAGLLPDAPRPDPAAVPEEARTGLRAQPARVPQPLHLQSDAGRQPQGLLRGPHRDHGRLRAQPDPLLVQADPAQHPGGAVPGGVHGGDPLLAQLHLLLPLQGAQGHGPHEALGHQEDQGGV